MQDIASLLSIRTKRALSVLGRVWSFMTTKGSNVRPIGRKRGAPYHSSVQCSHDSTVVFVLLSLREHHGYGTVDPSHPTVRH